MTVQITEGSTKRISVYYYGEISPFLTMECDSYSIDDDTGILTLVYEDCRIELDSNMYSYTIETI